jgi:hypothetical protein
MTETRPTARRAGFVIPVVRELPRPQQSREAPPDLPTGTSSQRELVRESLLGCPARRRR